MGEWITKFVPITEKCKAGKTFIDKLLDLTQDHLSDFSTYIYSIKLLFEETERDADPE